MDIEGKKYSVITQVEFDTGKDMSFSPDKSNFKTGMDKLLLDMKSSVEDIQPINLHSDLQQFINGLITDTAPRFSIIVDHSFLYRTVKRKIEDHLSDDFAYLENAVREFEECRTVHQFEQTWRFEDFTASEDSQDLDKIKELFEKWNQWDSKVSKHIQPQIFRGLIKADGKKLKDTLTLKVKKELASLRLHLFEIAENLNKGINKNLEKISEDVKKDMKNLDSYVGFVRCLKEADETIRECEGQKGRLEQMKVLLQKNRVKDENAGTLSGSQTYVQKLQVKIEQITNIIEQLQNELAKANDKAAMSREGNLAQLEQEIEKQKTQIRDQIDRLDSEILTKPDVKPELALQELNKIKRQYDGLKKKVEQY